MKLKLGPRMRQVLGLTDDEADALIDQSKEEQVAAIRMRVAQAIAATSLSDLRGRTRLEVKDIKQQRYRLGLKVTWDWPIPLAFDLKVVDESTWEIELVRDDNTDH